MVDCRDSFDSIFLCAFVDGHLFFEGHVIRIRQRPHFC